jgi:hypothetical protein
LRMSDALALSITIAQRWQDDIPTTGPPWGDHSRTVAARRRN